MITNDRALETNNVKGHKDSSHEILREMAIQKIHSKIEKVQKNIVQDVAAKIDVMVETLLTEIKQFDVKNNELKQLFQDQTIQQNGRNTKNLDKLPEKEFLPRNSLLTDLFEVKHIRTIYNIFIVILCLLFLNIIVHDFVADGTINIGLTPIKLGFGKFHIALVMWMCMQFIAISTFFLYKCWANSKWKETNVFLSRYWNKIWLTGFISYQILFMIFTMKYVLEFDLPIASSIAVLMEMTRFLMKNHAFVRSNVPKTLMVLQKNEDVKENNFQPNFRNFIYFLFCPTLVYRDNYPRTRQIRWQRVIWNFTEVIGVVFYLSFIFERLLFPNFRQFGENGISIEAKNLVGIIFSSMLPGIIIFLCAFYCLLHAWMNAWAEMLRFADRMFYRDWWNSTSFDTYYRTWNIVVHDWLYTYIYKDMFEIVLKRNKSASTLIVFLTSAAVHEIIIAVAFRFFYPVMFTFFAGFGVLLLFIMRKHQTIFGNIGMWMALCIGNGLMCALYIIESFARQNCPVSDGILYYFIPVSWKCHNIGFDPDWKVQLSS